MPGYFLFVTGTRTIRAAAVREGETYVLLRQLRYLQISLLAQVGVALR